MTTINDLSDAILCEIFLNIDIVKRQRLELVCKTWRKVIRHIWSTRRKLMFNLEMEDSVAEIETEITPDWIRFTTAWMSDVLAILKICEGNLTHVEIDDDAPDQDEVHEIFVPLQQNKDLIYFSIYSYDDKIIKSFVQCLPIEYLQELIIRRSAGASGDGTNMEKKIEEVLMRAKALKSLVAYFSALPTILKVIEKMNTLESLELGYLECSSEDDDVIFNPSGLVNLESLTISYERLIDDKFAIELTNNCKKLRAIKIQSESLTDTGLAVIGSLPNLRCVDLEISCNNEVLKYFSNLEEFYCDLSDCEESISNDALSDFLKRSPDLKICDFVSNSLNYECHVIATKANRHILFKPHE